MIGSPEFTQAAAKKEVRGLEKCALKLAKSGCSLLFNGSTRVTDTLQVGRL